MLARLTLRSALSLRKSWSLLPPQKVGVLRRSAKRSSKLVLLHAIRKELNTLAASSRFVRLLRGIVKPTGLSGLSKHILMPARRGLRKPR